MGGRRLTLVPIGLHVGPHDGLPLDGLDEQARSFALTGEARVDDFRVVRPAGKGGLPPLLHIREIEKDGEDAGARQHGRWIRARSLPTKLISMPRVVLPGLVVQKLNRLKIAARQLQQRAHALRQLVDERAANAVGGIAIRDRHVADRVREIVLIAKACLLYTSPSPRD